MSLQEYKGVLFDFDEYGGNININSNSAISRILKMSCSEKTRRSPKSATALSETVKALFHLMVDFDIISCSSTTAGTFCFNILCLTTEPLMRLSYKSYKNSADIGAEPARIAEFKPSAGLRSIY